MHGDSVHASKFLLRNDMSRGSWSMLTEGSAILAGFARGQPITPPCLFVLCVAIRPRSPSSARVRTIWQPIQCRMFTQYMNFVATGWVRRHVHCLLPQRPPRRAVPDGPFPGPEDVVEGTLPQWADEPVILWSSIVLLGLWTSDLKRSALENLLLLPVPQKLYQGRIRLSNLNTLVVPYSYAANKSNLPSGRANIEMPLCDGVRLYHEENIHPTFCRCYRV